jgi:hypothetical protein
MISLLFFLLLLMMGGVADAQIVSPMLAPPSVSQGGAIPNGGPPQIIGFSAANIAESETIVGDMTFARTGTNTYTATVTKLNGTAFGGLATLNAGAGLTTTTTTLSLTAPVTVALGGTGTITAPSAGGQLLISQSASAYGPVAMTGDATITPTGVVTVTKLNGIIPGGACGIGNFVSAMSASGIPTCTTPPSGVPSGTAPQIVGYTATGVPESDTVSGGAGGCSLTRTGAGAYQMVCTTYAPTASPTFTGVVTTGLIQATQVIASVSMGVQGPSGIFNAPDGGTWTNTGINDQIIKVTNTFTGPDSATWTSTGVNNGTHFGIGQASGTDPIDITDNVNNSADGVVLKNPSTGNGATAEFQVSNGTSVASFGLSGTGLSNPYIAANTQYLLSQATGGIMLVNTGSAPMYFKINSVTVGQFAANGFHLPAAPLEIASGGTGTATTPTVGQALVATSTSAYAPTTLTSANLSDTAATTWTPSLQFNGTAAGIAYGTLVGGYSKVGKQVTVSFVMTLTAIGSQPANSLATLCGLPAPVAQYNQGFWNFMALNGITLGAGGTVGGYYQNGDPATCIRFASQNTANNMTLQQMTNNNFSVGTNFQGSFTYMSQ